MTRTEVPTELHLNRKPAATGSLGWSHVAAGIVALGSMYWTFRDVHLARVLELCSALGAAGLGLILLPQLLSFSLDTWGWARAANALGYSARYGTLWIVRVASEAFALCLPAGIVFAESSKVHLLVQQAGLSVPRALTLVAVRKYLILSAQVAYLAIVAGLAAYELGFAPIQLPRPAAWAPCLSGATLALCLTALATRGLLVHGRLAARARSLWQRVSRSSRPEVGAQLGGTDRELIRFFALPQRIRLSISAWFLVAWLCEAAETYLILKLLGVELGFGAIAAMEVMLSLLRSVAFIVPGGIGIQDAGYAILLRALGLPDSVEVVAAFALLKRSKELLWASLGFTLSSRTRPSALGEKPAEQATARPC